MIKLPSDLDVVKRVRILRFKKVLAFLIALGIPIVIVAIMIGMLVAQIFFGVSNLWQAVVLMNVFVQSELILGRHYNDRVEQQFRDLSTEISESSKKHFSIANLSDIAIVPKNIQLGSNINSNAMVEIFKKGHYVLIHAFPEDLIIREYRDDEEQLNVELLETEEKEKALKELKEDVLVKKLTLPIEDFK